MVEVRSKEMARRQASGLVELLRRNDIASWVLEVPSDVDSRVQETLAGGPVRASTRPSFIRRTESACLYD